MSVRTPILTTSSEICAFAAVADAARARPAATTAASDFIVFISLGFSFGLLGWACSSRVRRRPQSRLFGHSRGPVLDRSGSRRTWITVSLLACESIPDDDPAQRSPLGNKGPAPLHFDV